RIARERADDLERNSALTEAHTLAITLQRLAALAAILDGDADQGSEALLVALADAHAAPAPLETLLCLDSLITCDLGAGSERRSWRSEHHELQSELGVVELPAFVPPDFCS